jgi:hypothetical protein
MLLNYFHVVPQYNVLDVEQNMMSYFCWLLLVELIPLLQKDVPLPFHKNTCLFMVSINLKLY